MAVILSGTSIVVKMAAFLAPADSPGVGGQLELYRRQVLVAAGAEVDVLSQSGWVLWHLN